MNRISELQSQNKTKQRTTKMPRTKKNKNHMERTEQKKKCKRKKTNSVARPLLKQSKLKQRGGAVQLNRQKKKKIEQKICVKTRPHSKKFSM